MTAVATLLLVSLLSLTVYVWSLAKLLVRSPRRGLVRTAVCRVIAALIYTTTACLVVAGVELHSVPLFVLVAVQMMWQGNAVADARLAGWRWPWYQSYEFTSRSR